MDILLSIFLLYITSKALSVYCGLNITLEEAKYLFLYLLSTYATGNVGEKILRKQSHGHIIHIHTITNIYPETCI